MEKKQVKAQTKKGLWTPEEDLILKTYVGSHGEGNWATVSEKSGLKRGGKSCRLRWMNYLRPNIKRGGMSQEEEDLIIRMHKLLGNRWSLIAGRLPGRTDNEVKNYWNTHLIKKLSSNKRNSIDANKGNDKNKKRKRKILKLQDICQTSPESTAQESDTKKKEKEESNATETWIQDAQIMNYYIESPLEMPLNNGTVLFDNDPMLAYLDSFVLFESFGGYGEEKCP